ncbi:hypothetical protein KA005_04055, partial [bacterium]|nr:hypothetical protein [bacterium]
YAGLSDVAFTIFLLDAIHYMRGTKPYWDLLGEVVDEMKFTERRFEIYRSDVSLSYEKRIEALGILSEHYDFLIETQMEIFRTIGIKTIRYGYGP